MSAPSSRRPAWAMNMHHYNAMLNASMRAGKPGEDFGTDNFTYDPAKVAKWQAPDHITAENLPKELYEASKDWTLAGAAIDTALERIWDLGDEAAQRVWPSYTHEHLLPSRTASQQGSSVGGASDLELVQSNSSTASLTCASTPASSFSQHSPPPKVDTAVTSTTALLKKYGPHPNQLPDSITSKPGMESPPFTPVTRSGSECGSGARSPAMLPKGHRDSIITPDFIKLLAELSLVTPSQCSFTSTSAPSIKVDTLAWNNCIKAYTAELDDLRDTALPRLRGFEQSIQKILFELRANPPKHITWKAAEATVVFAEWWKGAKDMGRERGAMVDVLEVPRLEDVVGGA